MPPYHATILSCHPERTHHAHGLCQSCYAIWRAEKNKTPLKNGSSTYTRQHRTYQLRHHYGITLEQYEEIFKKQNGLCAICGSPPRGRMKNLSVDHDHVTNNVRGLLCVTCNRALGYLENPEWHSKATEYLQSLPQNTPTQRGSAETLQ